MAEFQPTGSEPFTVRDLIDGVIIVSPVPCRRHQKIAFRLAISLDEMCPSEFDVLTAPFAIHPAGDDIELQPDVLVGRDADFTDKDLPAAPVLAVEILSPSTAIHDMNTKKAVYERLSIGSYWIIDPAEPAITVFELNADGEYQQTAKAAGAEPLEVSLPFQVRVIPNELLGRLAYR